MSDEELLQIVLDVEERLNWSFEPTEIFSTYQYTHRKAYKKGKGKD